MGGETQLLVPDSGSDEGSITATPSQDRAGNLLICFLSESLVFWKKTSDSLKKQAIHSFAHGCSFFGEQLEQFAHIAHQKWGNERIPNFLKNK